MMTQPVSILTALRWAFPRRAKKGLRRPGSERCRTSPGKSSAVFGQELGFEKVQ